MRGKADDRKKFFNAVRITPAYAGKSYRTHSVRQCLTDHPRRMCESVGLEVARLRRISIGPLKLGMLKPGTYRDLTAEELRAIRNAMGTGETAAPAKNKGRRR